VTSTHRRSNGQSHVASADMNPTRRERPRLTPNPMSPMATTGSNTRPRAWHAAQVKAGEIKSIDGIFERGQALLVAKEELEHGEYLKMIAIDLGWRQPRTAQYLTAVAGHPFLSKAKFRSLLPAHLTTLYELSLLDITERELTQMFEDNTLYRDITAAEVKQLATPLADKFNRACAILLELMQAIRTQDQRAQLEEALFTRYACSNDFTSELTLVTQWLGQLNSKVQARIDRFEGTAEERGEVSVT